MSLGCHQSVSNEKIQSAILNLKGCQLRCQDQLPAYNKAVALCMAHYITTNPYAKRLSDCNHNEDCMNAIYEEIRKRCEEENQGLFDEWKKCNQDCLDKFPLELGTK